MSPGMGGTKPFVRALLSVDMEGENRAACANATRSRGFALLPTALYAVWALGKFISQRPLVCVLLVPSRMT